MPNKKEAPEIIPPADAVIILGHDIKENLQKGKTEPSIDGKMRTIVGEDVFESGKANNIVVSTGPCARGVSIAKVMKGYLVSKGCKKKRF